MAPAGTKTLPRREPRSLAGLIAIHENNYFRLMRLAPDLGRFEGVYVSRVAGALDLYLCVLDRFKYTTSICLTYRFDTNDLSEMDVFQPRARIMIYHDARAVELIGHCRRQVTRKIYPWRSGQMPELDRKWELNRFLNKWLGFCGKQGHLFLEATAHRVERAPSIFGGAGNH